MPKNVFLMSFLYVFIACAVFITVTVHSKPTGDMAAHIAVAESYSNSEAGHWLHNAGSSWYRK